MGQELIVMSYEAWGMMKSFPSENLTAPAVWDENFEVMQAIVKL